MTRIAIFLIFFIGLASAGLIVLSGWQIPAPTTVVNKVIPNENLPK